MSELERAIFRACKSADTRFQEDGASGTKTWIRDYFLPALEREGLHIEMDEKLCSWCGRPKNSAACQRLHP